MALASGTQLGPYEILAPIGAGGMGEVYRAKDKRLDRTVAIKVLPSHLANEELRQRFEREARAVSSLNHPHICALYDIGRQDGIDFLVMEYLEGETLSERLAKGPLRSEQVLEYGIQIADALTQAHRQGVFHRDLKPGNIMMAKSGPKLLDFGLAKLADPQPAVGGLSMLPTQAEGLTQKGTILGTIQYMAPEQVEGKDTDARSDIFAFGAILYEMATGKRAFEGKSPASTMAAILERDPPPISTLQPMAPVALDRVVRRCLAKDPDDRWQTARDLMLELKWITQASQIATAPATPASSFETAAPAPSRRVGWQRFGWPVAAVLLVAVLTLGVVHFREALPEERSLRFSVAPPPKTVIHTFKLSPDGRYLAIAATTEGKRSLWVRALDSIEPQPLPGTDDAQYPFWSSDSRFIGFFGQGKLKKVAVTGGPPQTLCDATDGRGGTWNRDGVILFSPSPSSPIYRVSAAGGVPVEATTLESTGGGIHRFPEFLPGGRQFLFLASRAPAEKNGVYLASLDSKETRRILADLSSAAYAPGKSEQEGHLLFLRDSTLVAQPFDAGRVHTTGELFPVAEQVGFTNLNHGDFSVSANGELAFITGRGSTSGQLLWFDRAGKQLGAVGEPGPLANLALSPDETRVAVQRFDRSANTDLWMLELGRGTASRFTFDPWSDVTPVWSPDGTRIAYAANPDGHYNLYWKASTGAGQTELLLKTGESAFPTDWSRDGRFLVYTRVSPKTKLDLWLLPLSGESKPIPFLQTEFEETEGRLSPDGRWLAYVSDETGRDEVYVQPFPAAGGKWQVSTAGGIQPAWRRDGKELFYLSLDRQLTVVTVKAGSTFEAGVPQMLFATRTLTPSATLPRLYEVSADGRRLLIHTQVGDAVPTPITVVTNWMAGVKR